MSYKIGDYTPYYSNNTEIKPVNYTTTSVQQNSVFTDTIRDDSKAADGRDDGSIGLFSAVGHALKGGIKFFTGMFTDEKGDFSWGQTFKSLGTAALIGAATFIPVVGPLVLPTICTIGMIDGGLKVVQGFSNAMDAKTDAEAEAAWETLGNGATEGILSYVGYKKTGGFKNGWETAKTQYNKLTTTKPSATTAKVDAGKSTTPSNAEIAEQGKNLNTQHVNSKDATLVEKAYKDIPTAEEQTAYNKEVAHKNPTNSQRKELNKLAKKNAVEYSESHQVSNNAKGIDQLAKLREELAAQEAAPKTVTNGEYFMDGNRYVVKDGKIVEMQLKGQQAPQTKELNIANHNAKNDVLTRLANGEGSQTAPVVEAKPQTQATTGKKFLTKNYRNEWRAYRDAHASTPMKKSC